ncbi:MAG TPA: hypothetical protein VJL37_04665, partial [Flavobacterium sp.]|nr:hypothetical protein [Flavobacterium sp.]
MNDINRILQFIKGIGIEILEEKLGDDTFLPGLSLKANAVVIDFDKLKYPGDILHEAGHIAVASPETRALIGTAAIPEGWPDGGEEMGAILWS